MNKNEQNIRKILENIDEKDISNKIVDLLRKELGYLNESFFSAISLGILFSLTGMFIHSCMDSEKTKLEAIEKSFHAMKEMIIALNKKENQNEPRNMSNMQ